MNLPNSLTVLRIFFVPLLVVVLLTRQPNWNFWGLPIHFEVWGVLILLVAAATDAMDGYLARARREITTLGILLDPIADKLLISAAFISLASMGLVQAWMVVIIIGREFIVVGLREIASAANVSPAPGVPNLFNLTYTLTIVNNNTASGTITLTGGTGVTIIGTNTIAPATSRTYAVTITSPTTITLTNAMSGTT